MFINIFCNSFGGHISNFHSIQFSISTGGLSISGISCSYDITAVGSSCVVDSPQFTVNPSGITVGVYFEESKSLDTDPYTSSSNTFKSMIYTPPGIITFILILYASLSLFMCFYFPVLSMSYVYTQFLPII